MAWYKITRKDDPADIQLVASLEGIDPEVYDSIELGEDEPTELDGIKAALGDDAITAESMALEMVEQEACNHMEADIPTIRRQISIVLLWNEVQRLKLAQATNNIPADLLERRKQFPTLMALVALSGNTLAQVATAVENRLWDRVRRIALWEAKLLLGHDAVRAATTVDEKFSAAESVDWSE